jgi:imidazolonepropionase-like amidohydrolase
MPIPTITSASAAQAFVDAHIAEGSDYIKIIYEDGSEIGLSTALPTLNLETLKAVIAAAHLRNKLAVVHIMAPAFARDAIDAGADGLAHLFVGPASPDGFGQMVASHHAFVIPTLTVLHSACVDDSNATLARDPHLQPFLSLASRRNLETRFIEKSRALSCSGAEEAVRQLKAAHAPILAGTDAPNPGTEEGASMHQELVNLVHAGLSPLEALRSATSVPAGIFGLDGQGRVAVGKKADLILVRGDPTKSIACTRDIVAVWKGGARFDRDAYRERIESQVANPK